MSLFFAEQPTVIDDLRFLLEGKSPTRRGLASRNAAGGTYWEVLPD